MKDIMAEVCMAESLVGVLIFEWYLILKNVISN